MYLSFTFWLILAIILLIIGIVFCIKRMPTKRENRLNRKKIVIITLLIVGIVLLACFCYDLNYHYEINIERKYSNSVEKEAIQKAEELDLTSILNVTRYNGFGGEGGTNTPPTDATAYVWPNIVDKNVLDFYQNKIEKLRSNHISVRAFLNYMTEGKEYQKIFILYDNISQTITINENTYSIYFTEHPPYNSYSHCAIYVNGDLEVISMVTRSVQMNLSNSYIVTQDFDYEENYDLLAAFGGGAEQIIVLDQYYLPKLIMSRTTGGWVA